jgi:hypothetical protein
MGEPALVEDAFEEIAIAYVERVAVRSTMSKAWSRPRSGEASASMKWPMSGIADRRRLSLRKRLSRFGSSTRISSSNALRYFESSVYV